MKVLSGDAFVEVKCIHKPSFQQIPAESLTSIFLLQSLRVNVKVGDIVRIADNEEAPADLIVLSSEEFDGTFYVETSNLDGHAFV